jgi:cell division protein FtsB
MSMRRKIVWGRPLLTLTQFLVLAAVIIGLIVALDLNRRAQAGRLVGADGEALEAELEIQQTRQVELQATLTYVQSDEYVEVYAREEGGLLLPGETGIVPLMIEATPSPKPEMSPTPNPADNAQPWQAWWQLLFDAPLPAR